MKNILFSIIIPTYNSSKYIKKCLSSITNYKYNFNYEILVIDDTSTDNTVANISKFFKKIKIFKTKTNTGPGFCRNIGIKNSKGKFLIFLDSDDIILPGSLSFLSKIVNDNKNLKAIINNSLRNKPPYNNNYLFKLFKSNYVTTNDFINKSMDQNIHIDEVWKLVVNRNFLIKNNIFFPRIHIGEDQCFILKIFKYSKYLYLNNNLHIKHNYNAFGISQKIGNLACVSYALVVKYLNTIKSNKNDLMTYLRFKTHSVQILSFLNFILANKKKKSVILRNLTKEKINVKLFKRKLESFKNKIFLSLKRYDLNSKNLDFFIYCADIYGMGFHELIKDRCKIKNLIDDNTRIEKNYKFANKIKNFNSVNFSKKKQPIFFVCIKDLKKFANIKNRIEKSKLIDPIVERIVF